MARFKTIDITMMALFAALIAVCSWISVPLPFTPVPINLATFAVSVTGALLGYKKGTLSVLIYVLIGAVGVPVFAGFRGGLGHITGPTGGYIVGYITSAFICGFVLYLLSGIKVARSSAGKMPENMEPASEAGEIKSSTIAARADWYKIVIATVLGTLSCYVLGTIWFMVLTHNGLIASLSLCVIPFLPGDVMKTILTFLVVKAVAPRMPA